MMFPTILWTHKQKTHEFQWKQFQDWTLCVCKSLLKLVMSTNHSESCRFFRAFWDDICVPQENKCFLKYKYWKYLKILVIGFL